MPPSHATSFDDISIPARPGSVRPDPGARLQRAGPRRHRRQLSMGTAVLLLCCYLACAMLSEVAFRYAPGLRFGPVSSAAASFMAAMVALPLMDAPLRRVERGLRRGNPDAAPSP